MGCKKKYIAGYNNMSNDTSMRDLAKQGNKSIDGLIFKCVAVKKKSCKK